MSRSDLSTTASGPALRRDLIDASDAAHDSRRICWLDMHEYSVAATLLRMVERRAREQGAQRVRRVQVLVGESAGVEPEALRGAWDMVRSGTTCGGATLEITSPAARWVCVLCGKEVVPVEPILCPDCRVPARLESGSELSLAAIETE